MSHHYWQAKLWGLLHDPALKALHNASGRAKEGLWPNLAAMQGWISPKAEGSLLASVGDADLVAAASDRAAIGHLPVAIDYQVADRGHSLGPGLEMSHLLSGRKRFWQLPEEEHRALQQAGSRAEHLMQLEKKVIPDWIRQEEEDIQKVFWWFWRCFPQALVRKLGDENLLLLPAETRLPDGSLWSHTSVVAALAGCLAGYDEPKFTRPFLASFTFNPIQELIKASRKMRDFWAGSWLLHYLSARLCWRLAEKYGPDCLLYPSLYGQPLIDAWLLEKYPKFAEWIPQPSAHALLTAGFPNVILLLLPEERVEAAMQLAQQTLKEEWRHLAERALEHLQLERRWLVQLRPEDPTWEGWLEHQWQLYWAAAPLGSPQQRLKDTAILKSQEPVERDPWVSAQNRTYHLTGERQLFADAELKFLRISFWDPQKQQRRQYKPGLNVGSWWAAAVEATRRLQAACKQARDWQLPVAFGPRSTVSGLGPVVHPSPRDRWIGEGESRRLWQRQAGLFDGRERLNATETVKRALDKVLPELFPNLDEDKIAASYPDLTAGVAGYLKTHGRREQEHLEQACRAVEAIHPGIREVVREMRGKWGIPWADQQNLRYHPRLLNAGWLVEDLEADAATQKRCRQEIEATLSRYYPSINPASWYVLAAGDGDDMGQWLRGEKMRPYYDYLPQPLQRLADKQKDTIGQVINSEELDQVKDAFGEFVKNSRKRMGPATHSALSRALLDFSGQLVPYLTEQRYAGRLIYAGGDDVLAYTNLWEWDGWLWDIRQCFRGGEDDWREFANEGDYWQWQKAQLPPGLSRRPLFTLGSLASISFGVVIAHHSVPLAIALENLWEAEKDAKGQAYAHGSPKDSVQVRVLFANGNQLVGTSKFDTFDKWKDLLDFDWKLLGQQQDQSSLFEQAAQLWEQHPAPSLEAVPDWARLFCSRRDLFGGESEQRDRFQAKLIEFIQHFWQHSLPAQPAAWDLAIKNWFKLAAFVLRNRTVKLGRNGR